MKTRDKERLALAALWLLIAGLTLARPHGRFGDFWNHDAGIFWGLCTGWLVRSFIPARDEPEPFFRLTATLYIVVIAGLLALAALFVTDL